MVKYYFIAEQNHNIMTLQKKIATLRSRNLKKMDASLPKILTSKEELNKIVHKIEQEFSLTEYISKIRMLIDTNDLFVEQNLIFTPEKIKNSNFLQYNTRVSVTGDYIKIKKFIVDVLNLPGLVYFDSVGFVRDQVANQARNQGKVKFNFQLSLFFKKGV